MATITYVPIATVTASGSSSLMTLTSIPNTYKHLRLIYNARSSDSRNGGQSVSLYFNNVTTATYGKLEIQGNSNTSMSSFYQSATVCIEGSCTMNGSPAGLFSTNDVWIMDYASTSKYKSTLGRGGVSASGNTYSYFNTGQWNSTAAINSIYIYEPSNLSWVAGSTATVYGILG
jgi:hypothetical protein